MSRDWDEIRRESNEWLDRRRDRLDAEASGAAHTSEVYDALQSGDQDKARWLLDVPPSGADEPSGWTGGRGFSLVDIPQPEPPTAQQQLLEHATEFSRAVRRSRYIDSVTATRWTADVTLIELDDYVGGLATVDAIEAELIEVRADTRPPRDIFSMSVSNEMDHMKAFDGVETELRWLRLILEHVQRYVEG